MDDERNFVPQYFKKPARFYLKSDSEKCTSIGLSLFDSEENAKRQFEELSKRFRHEAYFMGQKVAKSTLLPDFGLTDKPNRQGHFTLHPFEEVALKNHFSIVASL